jgi:hypothetical protein
MVTLKGSWPILSLIRQRVIAQINAMLIKDGVVIKASKEEKEGRMTEDTILLVTLTIGTAIIGETQGGMVTGATQEEVVHQVVILHQIGVVITLQLRIR